MIDGVNDRPQDAKELLRMGWAKGKNALVIVPVLLLIGVVRRIQANVKAAKAQMERVAQEEEERQRAEHERQQGKIGGSGTAGAGTAGVTGTTPDGTNTGGQTGGGGNAGGTQPEPEIITPPPAPKSMSFYLSTQLDTTRVNRDVQKLLEEVVSVLTQENGVTVELRFDV